MLRTARAPCQRGKLRGVATKQDLQEWVLEAIEAKGGSAEPIEVARQIWQRHEHDLRQSSDLFYPWQYEMRWAAQRLRDAGRLAAKEGKRTGTWDFVR